MSLFYDFNEVIADVDEDARREAIDARRRRARMNHWCEDCRGMSGGPCSFGEEEDEDEPEEDSDYCGGCNPEPTISELECGRCDSCGKELA